MNHALIGHTGFVGSTLLRQRAFDALFRSTNIGEVAGRHFDTVVCAGAPAQKWIANQQPAEDLQKIESLIAHLKTLTCKTFILISTADVFQTPVHVTENSAVVEEGLHPYGLHRRYLEHFVEKHFPGHLIVRLPGLVGAGLRKNVIFDLLNQHNLHAIDSRAVFQFYPMANLWYDIQTALAAGLKLVHLTAAPVSVADVAELGFGKAFSHVLEGKPARYDMQTRHAALFGGQGAYQYSVRESLAAIRTYAQTEARAQ